VHHLPAPRPNLQNVWFCQALLAFLVYGHLVSSADAGFAALILLGVGLVASSKSAVESSAYPMT